MTSRYIAECSRIVYTIQCNSSLWIYNVNTNAIVNATDFANDNSIIVIIEMPELRLDNSQRHTILEYKKKFRGSDRATLKHKSKLLMLFMFTNNECYVIILPNQT